MTTKRVVLIILGIFVGIPATLMLIAFCFGFVMALVDPTYFDEEPTTSYKQEVPQSMVQEETAQTTDQAAKQLYMSGCDEYGDMTQYCSCTWDGLNSQYTIGQIAELGLEYQANGTMPDEAINIMADCLKYVN